jgi:hypothetical protein
LRLVQDNRSPEKEVIRRLLMLGGVSREWNFGPVGLAVVHQLTDATALVLYERFPTLLRGPFRMHISTGWLASFPKLLERALARQDETLLDFMASRLVTRICNQYTKELAKDVDKLADYYHKLLARPEEFSVRAGLVLGQVPAYTIGNWYNELIRTNRLARLFFERSTSSFLEDPVVLRDLLEAPEIHVQALALRALGLDDDRARLLAAKNLDLLQATLLRPLHRRTRALAFRALVNAAGTLEQAKTIHDRARQALDLPDKRYPKENLIGLIGALLARWPELRRPSERPVVYAAPPRNRAGAAG